MGDSHEAGSRPPGSPKKPRLTRKVQPPMEVPAADDPRIFITIPVPVKGRKPVMLRVPRFDFIDEPTFDEANEAAEAIPDDLMPRKAQRLSTLAWLKPFVPPKDYALCESLTLGQLDAVMLEWAAKSSIPLGEFLASAPSSLATTGAPCSTTSTAGDGPEATSDAA